MTTATHTRTYTFTPVGLDRFDTRTRPFAGREVRKVNPPGTPNQRTLKSFGHCFVETVDTGEFIGLVLERSLA